MDVNCALKYLSAEFYFDFKLDKNILFFIYCKLLLNGHGICKLSNTNQSVYNFEERLPSLEYFESYYKPGGVKDLRNERFLC